MKEGVCLAQKKQAHIPRFFRKLGFMLLPYFPNIKMDLIQGRIDQSPEAYLAEIAYKAIYMGCLVGASLVALGILTRNSSLVGFALLVSPVVLVFTFYTGLAMPKAKAKRIARHIEVELPYALRHLLIEVKSGVPLYQALVAVSKGYGMVSVEMKKIISEINGGVPEVKAIEESIFRNPSLSYRKAFWQIVNTMKTGTELEATLESTVNDIIREQLLSIKEYGQELNPWSMMYMLLGVIAPSLGITFMILLSNFTGSSVTKMTFYIVLVVLLAFQLVFINIIKTKRPMVKT